MMFRSFALAFVALLATPLAACNQTTASTAPRVPVTQPVGLVAGSSFSRDANGMVIPDDKPDQETLDFAARCSGRGASSVTLGMSECDLIGLKGTPSRVVAGIDINGLDQNAIWYVEGGVRTVYKFTGDKLVDILK